MRGFDHHNEQLFSFVRMDSRVPKDHLPRLIRGLVNVALQSMSDRFETLYDEGGRPSIAPEKLLRALLLMAFYSVRSERQLMEQLDFNLLFRWFVGLSADEPVWDASTFSKNRDRPLAGAIAAQFMDAVLNLPQVAPLLSSEHFSVDGTLIRAWASMRSFRAKDGDDQNGEPGRNGERDFHNEKRSNDTHASTTDPNARLYKKSKGSEAKLGFLGHLLMENRHGLVVDAKLTHASGTAEREAALDMLGDLPDRGTITVGADKAYDTRDFVGDARALGVTPHVAQNTKRRGGSAIDNRTTRRAGYRASQVVRKRIEGANGWIKEVAGMAQTKHRGLARVGWMLQFNAAACNLIRMPKLMPTG